MTKKLTIITIILLVFLLGGCSDDAEKSSDKTGDAKATTAQSKVTTAPTGQPETKGSTPPETTVQNKSGGRVAFEIPEYEGQPSVEINGNVPQFDDSIKTTESFEEYEPLDKQGRCTTAIANLSTDTQPAPSETRGDISAVHPSGWMSGQGWERCHLIGWQLSGENDNPRNLVTGSHYMNVDGMLPYENEINWYISDTGNHVLYEVTPIFEGKESVCKGVHMQAESVEDDGSGISFNVFCFNVSPGREIDYKTGAVTVVDEEVVSRNAFERGYVLNTNTMRFHYPSCSSVADMAEHNKETVNTSREELIKQGYSPCGNCEP